MTWGFFFLSGAARAARVWFGPFSALGARSKKPLGGSGASVLAAGGVAGGVLVLGLLGQ